MKTINLQVGLFKQTLALPARPAVYINLIGVPFFNSTPDALKNAYYKPDVGPSNFWHTPSQLGRVTFSLRFMSSEPRLSFSEGHGSPTVRYNSTLQ